MTKANDIIKPPKTPKKYTCNACHLITRNKKDYNKHLITAKHMNSLEGYDKIPKIVIFSCECGNIYKHNSGLWRHKKLCKLNDVKVDASNNDVKVDASNDINILSNIVIELVKNNTELQKQTNEIQKQNQELQKQMIEVCKNNNNNNNVINSHNKTFNLQLFLNEECKDAMNMSEFIKSIELQLTDLENFAEVDYIEGMSKLIITQLKNTDLYKRPVHCSDGKRETLYIKEENKWEKEGPENKKMIGAVRAVDQKNIDLLFQWKDKYPTCLNTDSQYNDHYIKLLRSVVGGSEENVNKVIKKVSKEVIIDK